MEMVLVVQPGLDATGEMALAECLKAGLLNWDEACLLRVVVHHDHHGENHDLETKYGK